ncbi:hypothetical protein ACFLTD_05375, partial [Elusimicrobiota bacterium]
AGRRFRWVLFGELFHLFYTKNKFKTLISYMDFKGTSCEISVGDFMPHLIHALSLLINREEVR